MPKIFVVIAAFNEEHRIGAVLEALLKYPYHIVVVDDGSSDATRTVVEKFPVALLYHKINRGQGAALYTGTLYALSQGADVVVHFDADGQHLAAEIERVITPIVAGKAQVVFGSKFLQANQIPLIKKYFITRPAIILNNLLTGIKLTDVHNGFRAFSKTAAEQINISQDGMAHSSEIVAQTKKLGLKYQEVPVTIIYHEFGQGFLGGLKILKDLLVKKISS